MRTRWFLALVTTFIMIVAPGVLLGQKKAGGANLSVRQKADVEITNLVRNINKTKDLSTKLGLMKTFVKSIKDLRAENSTQLPGDEIYMDMLVGSISEIPSAEKFKIESCGEYKDHIIASYDPRSGGKSQNPALNHAFDVLKGICSK